MPTANPFAFLSNPAKTAAYKKRPTRKYVFTPELPKTAGQGMRHLYHMVDKEVKLIRARGTIGTAKRVPYGKLYGAVPSRASMTPARMVSRVPLKYRYASDVSKYYDITAKAPSKFGSVAGNRKVGGMYLRLKKHLQDKLAVEIKKAESSVLKAEKTAHTLKKLEHENMIEELNGPARPRATAKAKAKPKAKPRAK